MDHFDPMLDWGIDNHLQATLIQIHPEDHEWDEIAQVVLQMEGPREILHKMLFLKDERNKRFKNRDFAP